MNEVKTSRWRKVALTGVLAPGLMLGAAGAIGFGLVPGASMPSAAAQSVLADGTCSAFGASAPSQTGLMSVADVAEQANPAVVTVLNIQPLSQADLSGFAGIQGLPEMPGMPGIDGPEGGIELPDSNDGASDEPQIETPQDGDTLVPVGSGSGFIVDSLGHVITNAHVVDDAEELTVVLADGTEIPATMIGAEPMLDVAILQLDLPAGQSVPGVIAFGDSDSLRAGEEVVAIGTALGSFPNTVSQGTVNGVDRSFPGEGGLTTMIQHDAEIWHGNSGGPLLNLAGEVVGINTAGIGSGMMGADSGSADMAFAVEGNTVCKAAAELLQNGEIVWPYMGLERDPSSAGQVVTEVVADGPAAAAGLMVGDVIISLDNAEVDRQNSLIEILFQYEPGEVVDVTVDRDGTTENFQVTLGERPEITQ